MIQLGVIADDFTGATDIASFLVSGGYRTIQINGDRLSALSAEQIEGFDAVVVSLKSRSIPAEDAISQSLAALSKLRDFGARQIFFKYCSTFDSTPKGNIGPVTDALMEALEVPFTVVCPALPVNGRTSYQGNLFVQGVPLAESGMRDHPVTPMTDSSLVRLMSSQSQGRVGLVPYEVVEQGELAVRTRLQELEADGVKYAVLDALTMQHLSILGKAVANMPLVTGGSGLGGALAENSSRGIEDFVAFTPQVGRSVVLSGSSSVMTNEQVRQYQQQASAREVDVDQLMQAGASYEDELVHWYDQHSQEVLAPLLFATAEPEKVRANQERYGGEVVSEAIERLFASIAKRLVDNGVVRVIVAGGETSGAVATALGFDAFEVGPTIAPGVPWIRSIDGRLDLALKSGNFGDPNFFLDAQEV